MPQVPFHTSASAIPVEGKQPSAIDAVQALPKSNYATQPFTLSTSQFRPSRWYDQYTNLAMGLHVLFLAPREAQPRLTLLLLHHLKQVLNLSNDQLKQLLNNYQQQGLHKQRWYDTIPYLTFTLEVLKTLPSSQVRRISKQWHGGFEPFLNGNLSTDSIASL
ncbi:MAG: hypothetical protein ACKO34_08640 [Vampirovibrionales bacterium]